ncbi:MAG: RDD family protein, partial [Acidimicrobiales bacterium]
MSAYQYPAMPPAYAGAPSDPTAVMGRRIGAWIIDFLLWLLLGAFLGPTPLSPFAEYVDTNDFPSVECDDIERVNDLSACTEIGDRLYFVEGGEAGIAFVVAWIIAPLAYAAVQGATGRSPGKALFGVRAVDEFGNPPRFGKSLVRTLLWVVDGIPCIIPLVGFVTGLTSNGHRRVGDMAAKTFVVGKDHSGPVIVAGLATAATQGYPGAGYGAPGQQWGTPPPGPPGAPGQPQPWGAPPPGAPGGPPTGSWDQPSGGFPVPGAAPTGVPGGPGGPAGAGPSDRAAPPSGWA